MKKMTNIQSMAAYFDESPCYDADYGDAFVALAKDAAVPLTQGTRVVDLGAGGGTIAHAFSQHAKGVQITALDISRGSLALTKQRVPAATCVVGNLEKALPFSDRVFDVATICCAFFYVTNRPQLVREIGRILKPQGWLMMDIHSSPGLNCGTGIPSNPEVDARETEATLAKNGFKMVAKHVSKCGVHGEYLAAMQYRL